MEIRKPFIIAAVCPMKTETGTLGFDEEEGVLKKNLPLRKIENPGFGFLFPSFTNRSADKDQAMCFRTEKLDIAEALFGQTLPKPEKPARKTAAETVPAQAMTIHMENGGASGEQPEGNTVPAEKPEKQPSSRDTEEDEPITGELTADGLSRPRQRERRSPSAYQGTGGASSGA